MCTSSMGCIMLDDQDLESETTSVNYLKREKEHNLKCFCKKQLFFNFSFD